MPSTSYSSLPPSEQWDYDVFLSFRGEDTRKTFVAHLYRELRRAGINTFKDDETLERGASISPQLVNAIKRSRFAIIIFSKNYASSKWCLDELVKIMECRNEIGQVVIPIFYDINPSEVRSQRNSFAEAFSKYEEEFKGDTNKVHSWRKALNKAANLAGHDLHSTTYNGNESWCIQRIVKEIANELCQKSMISGTLVGAESQIQAVSSMLMMECEDVRFIGISGMGGIGKTTIARAIFDRFAHRFEGACFVANIKENQDKQGLLSLQKTVLSKVLTIESVNLADEYGGIDIIRKRLGFKKVLVVLDDVDHQNQLDGLAGAHDWFGKYSRIIITARDEHLLLNCDDTYRVSLLAIAEATRLFSWHAFRKTSPVNGFELFSHRVVQYAGGLPLALKVLGSFLRGRNIKQWRSALDTLQDIPNDEIISKLKISYDGLGDKVKQVFLDLTCSFVTSDAATLKKLFTEIIIDVLVEKSLLFVSSFGRIGIHDLIREMGRRIAVQEYPRRRIWLHEDIADILSEHTGGEAIEVILIPLMSSSEENTIHLSNEVFRHMKRLRIFVSSSHKNVMYFCSHDPIKFLPNSLCWINWSYYPSPSLPENFEPPKLVGLIMHCSYVVNLWKGSKHLNRLSILDLSDSRKLIQISDLSGSPNLERLILCHCVRLVEVHPSVGALKKLTILDVEGCEKLERLPSKFQSGSLEVLNFSGCRSLRKVPDIQQNVNRLTEFKKPNFGVLELTSSFLSYLDLSGCSNIETLPSSMCRLKNLKYLYLNRCTKLKNLPEDICELVNLEGLDASETSVWCTPNSITCLRKLKYLSFRKVPKAFHLSDLCSWGCFAQLDLKFQLPSTLSVFCTLTRLDLSACNLFDGSIPEDLGCLASLLELNLSRNNFTFLPKSIVLLNRLRHLDITYCEKLTELPELPPRIMKLFLDDRFALESIPTLPTMYKELYLVSFANQKLQEMWCASRRESSGAKMRNCLRKNMTDMLEQILLPFLSIVQLKLVFDDQRRGGRFGIVFPRSDPSAKVPRWFKYRKTCSTRISFNLKRHWYNNKFMGFAIYCQLPFLNDESPKNRNRQFAFSLLWGATITTKLVPGRTAMDQQTPAKIVHLQVSNVVAYGSHDCFIFLQLDLRKLHFNGKGKGTMLIDNPNDYCRFEASLDCRMSSNWGVRLVYADDIEVMRLEWAWQSNRFELEHLHEEDLELCTGRLKELSVPGEIRYFYATLIFYELPVLSTCPRCLSFAEDLTHVFLNCKYSQLVWEGSRLGLNFKVGTPVEFQEWLLKWTLSAPENEDFSFSLAVLWAIWKHRNKLVHERAVFVPSEVISTAIKEHSRFPYSVGIAIRELNEVHRGTIVDVNAFNVDSDVQLDDNVLVMEVKGAWKEGQEWAGMAWVAYRWNSGVKVAEARRSLKVRSKLHAEVHAFEHAVKWSLVIDSPIVIFSDNQILIKELHNSDCCSDQDIVCMLHECLEFMEANEISWKVVKVASYAVSAAKRAAKMAMKTHMDVLIWDPIDI
ncbi:TMV resistance protein N-like [Nicotiana sylvestris]